MKTQNKKNTSIKQIARALFIHSFLFIGTQLYAQDIITLTNGNKIEAKVTEISTNTVKYKKFNNPDGPLYTIRLKEVYNIRYENGSTEDFAKTAHEKAVKEKEIKRANKKLDDKGFFIEGLVGVMDFTTFRTRQEYVYDPVNDPYAYNGWYETVTEKHNATAPMLGMRMGSKFYIKNEEKKYTSGFQLNWLALQIGVGDGAGVNMQLLNPGYTGILKFNEEMGMEFNLCTGFSVLARDLDLDMFGFIPIIEFDPNLGININPGAKLRMKGFGVGFDYTYMTTLQGGNPMTHNTFNFTIGRKF